MKEKINLVTIKIDKNQKYDEVMQCLKEGEHQVLQLIENWAEESSISVVIDINSMTRREDFDKIDKWMCQPRIIQKYNKRAKIFFKF